MTRPSTRCIVCGKRIQLSRNNAPQADGDTCWECMTFGYGKDESEAEIAEYKAEESALRASRPLR